MAFIEKNELLELGAYHESGHIVFGYFAGYKVTSTRVNSLDPGAGETKFNYGDDLLLITSILYPKEFASTFNSLPKEVRQRTPYVGNKLHTILLAGSCAEAYLNHEIKKRPTGQEEISGPDLAGIMQIQRVFNLLGIPFSSETHQENYTMVYGAMHNKEIWQGIDALAKKLLAAPDYVLYQPEIEQILADAGCLSFIDRLTNG
jgi:hypothetical protein